MANNQFPSKMRVESPEINSIKVTSEHISNWLHKDFKEIVKPLQNLEKLPELFTSLESRLVEQFRISLSGQVAVEMKAREANIRVAEQKSVIVQSEIKQKEDDYVHDNESTRERYSERGERLTQQHEAYQRELDGHVFEITERIYPEQIQSKFSYISQPFWRAIAKHTDELATARSSALLESYKVVLQATDSFSEARKKRYKELGDLTESQDIKAGSYDLPYWYVVVEDAATKRRHIDVYFDWEVQDMASDSNPSTERNDIGYVNRTRPEDAIERLRQGIIYRMNLDAMASLPPESSAAISANLRARNVPEEEVNRFKKDCILYGQ